MQDLKIRTKSSDPFEEGNLSLRRSSSLEAPEFGSFHQYSTKSKSSTINSEPINETTDTSENSQLKIEEHNDHNDDDDDDDDDEADITNRLLESASEYLSERKKDNSDAINQSNSEQFTQDKQKSLDKVYFY